MINQIRRLSSRHIKFTQIILTFNEFGYNECQTPIKVQDLLGKSKGGKSLQVV